MNEKEKAKIMEPWLAGPCNRKKFDKECGGRLLYFSREILRKILDDGFVINLSQMVRNFNFFKEAERIYYYRDIFYGFCNGSIFCFEFVFFRKSKNPCILFYPETECSEYIENLIKDIGVDIPVIYSDLSFFDSY